MYFFGETPVAFLKESLKYAGEEKPSLSPISETESAFSSSISFAFSMRMRIRYSKGVSPVTCLKVRRK